jgi:hypothetical protein
MRFLLEEGFFFSISVRGRMYRCASHKEDGAGDAP